MTRLALATVFAGPGAVTGYAAAVIAVLMIVLWLVSVLIKDVSIVDPVWDQPSSSSH
jgi:steroid 5-alpha reductase family enzyme